MKFLVFLALFASVVYALPVAEEVDQDVFSEPLLAVVDFETDNLDFENSDVERIKRQFVGYPNPASIGGGYGGQQGGYGGQQGGYGGQQGGYGGQQGGGFGGGHHRGHHGGHGGHHY